MTMPSGVPIKRNGFTFIELLVVITIMSVLMAIAGMAYSQWMNKYRLEGQVKEMHIDLMNARVQAMQRNTIFFVQVTANSYSLIEDRNNNGVLNPDPDDTTRLTKQLRYPSNWIDTAVIDARGLVSSLTSTITFNTGGVIAEYDCITLMPTRIRMGKLNGTNCAPR